MTISDNQAVIALLRMKEHIERLERARQESIAIVGLAARTPFESHGVTMWEGLSKGVDASNEIPPDRWDADAFYNADPRAPNKAITKRGSFLSNVTEFDASFFAIAPVEAQIMDPQQRMVLEMAWEAFAHAGASLTSLRQVRTGVFLGVCVNDYSALAAAAGDLPQALAPYLTTGNAASIVAGRVSYALGLTGPSIVVDTACSSSLVALHLACESLRARTSDVALAGGVNLILSPTTLVMLSKLDALSADGRCRSFDAKGSGFGRGEGGGIVVLKRLSDAVRDGDRVLAVVRGSAVNQDGRSDGLTAPNGQAQQDVIRSALDFAKLTPGDVQYVEAHGTGTVLGDPIEVDALSEVFGAGHSKSSPLAIGSVKSNIGHLEGAAGISGLIKTILSIQHRELPPSLHFQTPNPHIPWEEIPLRVQTKLGPWPEPSKPLVAGVSSFGLSGTNAHVVVSEPPAVAADAWSDADRLAAEAKLLPLCVSAKTPEALRVYAERFAKHLASPLEAPATWRDVAFTSSVRSTHLEHRALVLGTSAAEWSEKLTSLALGQMPSGVVTGDATSPEERAVFVFSGQGTQWWGMGRDLLEREPVFRETLEECAGHIRKYADWSLLEELGRDEATSQLHRTDIAQPSLVSLQMGLVRLLASWGVKPSAVVGHSVGEISAACAAGVLSLEQACRVATVRGRVMHKASGQGKMASVRLSAERAETLVRDFPGLEVGAYNGLESVVLSGASGAVESALAMLQAQGLEVKELRVDYAFHSAQMDPFKSELASALAWLTPAPSRLPIVSTLTGTTNANFDGGYWVRQMREPVRFAQAVQVLFEREYELFVEVGPHPVLLASIDDASSGTSKRRTLVPTLRRGGGQSSLLEAIGALHCAGYPVEWENVLGGRGRVVSLPSYPWQRQRHWLPVAKAARRRGSDSPWALIHANFAPSDQPGKHFVEFELDLKDSAYAYLADHVVQGGVWFPGAAFLEMALEAGAVAFEGRDVHVEEVTFSQALMIDAGEALLVQLALSSEQEGARRFRIASRPLKDSASAWTEHVSGQLAADKATSDGKHATLNELQKRCSREIEVSGLYDDFVAMGISYGAAFRGIEQVWGGEGEALSKLARLEALTESVSGYVVHPSVLDAAFQTLAAVKKEAGAGRTYVPSTVGSLHVVSNATARWAHVKVRSATDEVVECDVVLLDERGSPVAEVKALRAVALGRAGDKLDDWLFEQAWRPSASKTAESGGGRWLLLADGQGVAIGLRTWLEARGAEVVTASRGAGFTKTDATHYVVDPLEPASMVRLMKEAYGKSPPKRIVHLLSLDTRDAAESALDEGVAQRAEDLTCTSSLHLVQALAQMEWSEPPRLFVVTRSCQAALGSRDVRFPEQALAWGFGASVAHEMMELRTTLIDVDEGTPAEALGRELVGADDENRVALRGSERLVPRLTRHVRAKAVPGALRLLTVGTGEGYMLDALEPGRLDSLTLRPAVVPTAGPGQVVIRTRASGLNFRDVLIAQGMYPGLGEGRLPMGGECAGVVQAVGEGVSTLGPGDEVVAVAPYTFDAHVVAWEELVVKKPASLTFEQAAAMPSVVMTVLYALERVGRLRKGERILIHAATGGVGLAAVQYAKHVGAEIYATAGSEKKRAYLRTLGVAHVYDSRTLSWAEEVKRDTGGRGVDVVLNSLAGEALLKGVSVLAPFGRFVELGKRDIYENSALGLYGIRNNITVSAVALDQLALERPEESRALLEETFRLVEEGVFSPLPVECFPVSRALDALEHLARARHIGKVVITAEETLAVRDPGRSDQIEPDKTYLVTGGLGGLGLVVAKRLAKLGAKHVALMGRSAPSEGAKAAIGELEASGVFVYVMTANVAQHGALASALAELGRSAPPVAGVVHAAGVLDDATLLNLTAARIGPVLAPKVMGTLVLDRLLPDLGLRVYFSSVAGVLGSGGQAHYAAANAFLDASAHHLRARSQHALSVDWGAWGEVGLVATNERIDNIARQGLAVLASAEGAELFERTLPSSNAQLVAFPVDVRQWREANPQLAGMPLLREMLTSSSLRSSHGNTGLLQRIEAAVSEPDRVGVVEDYLRTVVATVLRSSTELVHRTATFKQLGFDSLMTVSLKNTLERDLAIPMSTATLFAHPSVEKLALYVARKLTPASSGTTSSEPYSPFVVEIVKSAETPEAPANTALPSLDDMLARLGKRGYL